MRRENGFGVNIIGGANTSWNHVYIKKVTPGERAGRSLLRATELFFCCSTEIIHHPDTGFHRSPFRIYLRTRTQTHNMNGLGGAAADTGKLAVHDRIIAVSATTMVSISHNDAVDAFRNAPPEVP